MFDQTKVLNHHQGSGIRERLVKQEREKIKTSKDEERDKQETEIKKKLQKNFEKEKESFRKRNVSESHEAKMLVTDVEDGCWWQI